MNILDDLLSFIADFLYVAGNFSMTRMLLLIGGIAILVAILVLYCNAS